MDLTSGFGNISFLMKLTKNHQMLKDHNFRNEANTKREFSVHAQTQLQIRKPIQRSSKRA